MNAMDIALARAAVNRARAALSKDNAGVPMGTFGAGPHARAAYLKATARQLADHVETLLAIVESRSPMERAA